MKVKKILKTIYVVGIFGLLIAIGIKTFVGKATARQKRRKLNLNHRLILPSVMSLISIFLQISASGADLLV